MRMMCRNRVFRKLSLQQSPVSQMRLTDGTIGIIRVDGNLQEYNDTSGEVRRTLNVIHRHSQLLPFRHMRWFPKRMSKRSYPGF
jgi:hypothetical protein